MYGAMESHEGIYVWAGVYFVSFYVIGPLIMMALVTSVFINLFLNQAMSSAGNLNLQEFLARQQDQDVEMQGTHNLKLFTPWFTFQFEDNVTCFCIKPTPKIRIDIFSHNYCKYYYFPQN